MKLKAFFNKLNNTPGEIEFTDTMAVVEANYTFSETKFTNGDTINESGENSGSCKLFAFAQMNDLSIEQTLACFGTYYRKDVLEHPDATDHQNIRNFITHGWAGITFEGQALKNI